MLSAMGSSVTIARKCPCGHMNNVALSYNRGIKNPALTHLPLWPMPTRGVLVCLEQLSSCRNYKSAWRRLPNDDCPILVVGNWQFGKRSRQLIDPLRVKNLRDI